MPLDWSHGEEQLTVYWRCLDSCVYCLKLAGNLIYAVKAKNINGRKYDSCCDMIIYISQRDRGSKVSFRNRG